MFRWRIQLYWSMCQPNRCFVVVLGVVVVDVLGVVVVVVVVVFVVVAA